MNIAQHRPGGPTETGHPPAALQVRGLCKAYGAIVVADALSFALRSGECLGVIGPNGAGKSSLFNLLAGTARPDAGSARLGGTELMGLPPHRRARLGLARAFQIPQAFPSLSVLDNVRAAATFGAGLPAAAALQATDEALVRTGLARVARQPASALPLLDRKRLEVAKALAARPRLLLLDEVAGGLTEPEVQQMIELVWAVKPQLAVIWIEHIPHALRAVADRVMVLNFGRCLLDDTPQVVLDSDLVREIYMGVPRDAAAA